MRLLRRTMLSCLVLAGTMVDLRAADNSKTFEEFQSRVEKEFAPKLATVIAKLGAGKIDTALDDIETKLGFTYKKTKGPFGVDGRKEFRTKWRKIAPHWPNYDCVEIVGIQKYSSQSCQVFCVAHGNKSPHFYRVSVAEYRGQLCMGTFNYQLKQTETELQERPQITHKLWKRFTITPKSLKAVPAAGVGEKRQIDDLLGNVVAVIRSCGRKDTDRALKKMEELFGVTARKGTGPFQTDVRTKLAQQAVSKFSEVPHPFDTIEFVGVSNYSSQCFNVYVFGHLRGGVKLFRFSVHVFGGKQRIFSLAVISRLEDIEKELARIKIKRSKKFPATPVQTAKKP